jgi:hypothetical protein
MYTVRRILSAYKDVYLESLTKLQVCWDTYTFIDLNEAFSSCHRRNWNQKVQDVPWVSDSARIHWHLGIWYFSVNAIFAGLSLNSVVKWNLFDTYTTDFIRSVLMLLEEGAVHNSTGSLVYMNVYTWKGCPVVKNICWRARATTPFISGEKVPSDVGCVGFIILSIYRHELDLFSLGVPSYIHHIW